MKKNTDSGDGIVEPEKSFGVFLPCDRQNMSEFLSSLFGEVQKISQVFYGKFELSYDEIVGFHYLLQQRVTQNHNSRIVSIVIKVIYNNNSSVTFNSIEEFKGYNEVKPLIPVAIHMSWVVFVQFPEKTMPQKQSIDLSIVSNKDNENPLFDIEDMFRLKTYLSEGCIYFSISHTERSWGADIQSLLASHVATIMEKEGTFRLLLREKADLLSILTSISLMLLPLFF